MLKRCLLFFICLALLVGCKTETEKVEKKITAIGGVRYGGDFRFMSKEKVKQLFPLSITDVYANRVSSQIFEGLLKVDPSTMAVVPALAESYEISDDAKTFTFHLREDVYFHDDDCFPDGKGRAVNADDFVFMFELACSKHELNSIAWLLKGKILGARAYYNGEADHLEGVEAVDAKTLKIRLVQPFTGFYKVITHYGLSVFPKEAYEKYGNEIILNPVGTGAFILDELTDEGVILKRNNNYWGRDEFNNQLPFLDRVIMTYSKNKTDELMSFRAGEIDLVLDIPVEEVDNVLGTLQEAQEGKNIKHKVDSKSSLNIKYFGFAHDSEEFSSKEVRMAFNLAIDRHAIVETWLEGEGWVIEHGFVPKMKGYPHKEVKGYSFNLEKAKSLMKKAGYPEGKNFPGVDLYVNATEGSAAHKLAQGVVFSLKQNLGVNINIKLCTIAEREEALQKGEAIFWRTGWIADYPDPENFLSLFYGGNIEHSHTNVNPFKYESEKFDALFEKALREQDNVKRMELFAKCDQIIIDDAVVMPLITDDFVTMVNQKIRRFVTNKMEQLDFSNVFIKE